MSLGSISNTPPSGPIVPPDMTLDTITSDINTTHATYITALNQFNAAKNAYNNAKAAVASFLSFANITTPADWDALGTNREAMLIQYRDLLTTLDTAGAALSNATTPILTAGTAFVDALARKQIYADQTDQSSIATALNTILSLPLQPPLTASQIAQINQAKANIVTATSGTPAAQMLTAFLNMRHNEYEIALANTHVITSGITKDSTWFHYLDPDSGVTYDQVTSANETFSAYVNTLQSYVNQRAGFNAAVQTAADNYKAAYQNVQPPLINAVSAIIDYANSWITNLNTLYTQTQVTLQQKRDDFIAATNQALAEHYATVTMPTLTEAEMLEEIQNYTTQIANLQNLKTSTTEIPTLPALTSSMSLADLMRTISQVQLTTWSLIRSIQNSESTLNSARLQAALACLNLYVSGLAKFNAWAGVVYTLDQAYTDTTSADNTARYGTFAATYALWQDLFANHIDIVNSAIDVLNAQITQINGNATILVDLTNSIQTDIVDAVNAEEGSRATAQMYLDFLNIYSPYPWGTPISDYTAMESMPPISPFSHFGGGELPALPLTPPLPAADLLPEDFNTQVTSLNNAVAIVLPVINVLGDILTQKLTAAGITIPGSLEQLLLAGTFTVRDFMTSLNEFEQPTSLLVGFLRQFLISESTSEATKAEIENLLKFLKNSVITLNSSSAGQGAGTGISAATANFLASASAVSRALTQLTSSDVFARMVQEAVEVAATLAGLNVASSTTIQIPPTVFGQTTAQTTTPATNEASILLNMMAQLILSAADVQSLRNNALTMLQTNPDLASLSSAQIEQLITAVVAVQQNLLMFSAIASAIQAGMTPGQVITALFPQATISTVGTAEQFSSMGFSREASAALAAFALDNAALVQTLTSSGMTQATILNVLALLAGTQGIVSLTSQVPGGPAFLANMITTLNQAGIRLTIPFSSPIDFLKELEAQIEEKIADDKRAELRRELLERPEPVPLGEPTAQSFATFFSNLQQIFTPQAAAPTEAPTTLISPSDILQNFVDRFRNLSPEIREPLIASAQAVLPKISAATTPSITAEQLASLALATRLNVVSPKDAANVLNLTLLQMQGQLKTPSDIATAIAHRLFTPTDAEREQIREDLRKYEQKVSTGTFNTQILQALSTETISQLQVAAKSFYANQSDATATTQAYLSFAKTVRRLSDFNSVFVNFLINPAKLIQRQFSLLTGTTTDIRQQIPVILSG